MKTILFLLLALVTDTSFAVEFKALMNAGPKLSVSCERGETSCIELCKGETECVIETVLCRDCMGSGLFFTELYRSLGRSLLPSQEMPLEKIIKSLKEKKMMVMDRRFFLNIIEDYNSFDFKEYYSLLCDYQDSMPILFAELDSKQVPDFAKISVFCPLSQTAKILRFE